MKSDTNGTDTTMIPQKELLFFVRLGLPDIIKMLKSEEERILNLTNPAIINYDGLNIQNSNISRKPRQYAEEMDRIRRSYVDLRIRYEEIRAQVLQNILKIRMPTQREVMYGYVIEGKTWEDISDERSVCLEAVRGAYVRALHSYIEMFDNEAEIDSDLYTKIKAS